MYLGSEEIRKLIKEKGLVSDYIDLEKQLQPNGFDLTVGKVYQICTQGEIACDGKITPALIELPIHIGDFWTLNEGVYIIAFNEILKFPKGIAGIGIQRSTVARCGAMINVSSWDSGYEGRGQNVLVVHNRLGLNLQQNARVVQIHFIKIIGKNFSYKGNYQHENIRGR